MAKKHSKILSELILRPISVVYGAAVWLRNKFYDWGWKKSRSFDIPVIVVGNLAVGGTGKTPHTEYIVSQLAGEYKVAVLSRGYKRLTKGFILASTTSSPDDIGDEPYQMYNKFLGKIKLAVCEDRCFGIDRLREIYPDINLVILDDAYQHRRVKPTISVVTMEYNRMPDIDKFLPYGRLRDSFDSLRRATMVIVTKCPEMNPLDFRLVKNRLNLYPSQHLFFSQYAYGNMQSVFPEFSTYIPYMTQLTEADSILCVTGIANPRPFVRYLRSFKAKVKVIHFSDHHRFDKHDLDLIASRYNKLSDKARRMIVTTEKDAVRFANNPYFPQALKSCIFYIPIEVQFVNFQRENFVQELRDELRHASQATH
ncbi:MAG: tetraacyldisaccharide 4'-kinase [Bacteroidales bacterium]|nr:tetraacyldisaccharide 4'-kinase [Bacteroidales bacterium]